MPRPITVTVFGKHAKVRGDLQAGVNPLRRGRRETRIVMVSYKGACVFLGTLSRSNQPSGNAAGQTDPWQLVDERGSADFDQAVLGAVPAYDRGVRLGGGTLHVDTVYYAKNKYWLLWIRYLLHRRAQGHAGSYESLAGNLTSSAKSKAVNALGWVNSLGRRFSRQNSLDLVNESEDMDVQHFSTGAQMQHLHRLIELDQLEQEQHMETAEAQRIMDELGDGADATPSGAITF